MVNAITPTLLGLSRALRRERLLEGGLRCLTSTLALWLAWFGLDNLLRLPAGIRLAMALAGLAWPAWLAWRCVLRPGVWRMRAERTARDLERRFGMQDNLLINACQFEQRGPAGAAGGFADRTVQDGLRRAGAVPRAALVNRALMMRLGGLALTLTLAWSLYAGLLTRHAGNAWQRFSRPLADIPPVGSYAVHLDPGGSVTLYEGERLDVRVRVTEFGGGRLVIPPEAPVVRRSQRAGAGESSLALAAIPQPGTPGLYGCTFENVREPFACRAVCGEVWSPALRVRIRRLPRLLSAGFRVVPPAYTALPAETRPGPPAVLAALPGSRVTIDLTCDRDVAGLNGHVGTNRWEFVPAGEQAWRAVTTIDSAGEYVLTVREEDDTAVRELARGSVVELADAAPAVRFETDMRNRMVWPGETLEIPVVARDDFGLQALAVTVRAAVGRQAPVPLQRWSYQGPPGRPGEVVERLALTVDPARFEPGEVYLLEASALDWRPGAAAGRAEPIVLRVRRPQDAAASGEQASAMAALHRAIAEQRRALGLTRNLELHLDEARLSGNLARHRTALSESQVRAQKHGRDARVEQVTLGHTAAADRLRDLVENEMAWVLAGVAAFDEADTAALPERVKRAATRQAYILDELIALLGRLGAADRPTTSAGGTEPPPAPTSEDRARDLRDLLQDFSHAQKRIVEQSRALLERGPDDLTEEEQEILGQLAREEARWAAMLRDKVEDLSRNPLQDFADGKLAEELNEVYQEVTAAAESLYARKVELAVPQEQGGLENAEELLHNLERWLTDKPDYQKWLMEEPPQTPDAPLAELPAELEDIVGELLDREEAMTEEVEDVTSSWIDSLDKGAGWDAMDGPISSMSAKGVTGNQLPNQQEIGGRSGEGRTGRSQGQMVESAAEGKDGRPTPARVSETPFESGSVADKSAEDPGGATGGGKLSGFAGEGLRGPTPPPRLDQMQRLAGQQTEIRQDAERLSLHLRAYGLPSGDVEAAVSRMREVESLARAGSGAGIRRSFNAAIDTLREARGAISREAVTRRERGALPRQTAEALWAGLQDAMPPGYEELVAAYFRRLAESAQNEVGADEAPAPAQ